MRYDIPFHNDFERSLSTINKWKVYPRLKNGRTLDVNALKVIKKVFELRDDIVHPKPERILAGSKEPAKGKSAQAKIERIDKGEMIIELNSVFQAVHRIDEDERAEYEKRPWLCNLQRVETSDPRA